MIKTLKTIIKTILIYLYDLNQDLRYTSLVHGLDTQEKLLSSLVISAHTIEKGLTMPNRRFPFGESKVEAIVSGCLDYCRKDYDITEPRFVDIVGVLQEYGNTMKDVGLSVPLMDKIVFLVNQLQIKNDYSQLYSVQRESYFSGVEDSFESFSQSRRSCRYLMGHVDNDILNKALELSMNAPSTCNRQSHRIHVLESEESKRIILSIQSGSRNFGNLADKFILVTSDLRCWNSGTQRNGPYIDCGIYVMNLLYCLHYYKIAACTLNLYLDKKKTRKLHESLNLSNNEVPIALIAVGLPSEQFDLTRSFRRKANEIITRH